MRLAAGAGILALSLLGACDAFCPGEARPAQPGRYVAGVAAPMCANVTIAPVTSDPEQHVMTLSADRKTVQETFVRNGKTYAIEYDVVSIGTTSLNI